MTAQYITPQTGGSYGLGRVFSPNSFSHEGGYKTRMAVEPGSGIVEIFMVQIAPPPTENGKHLDGLFTRIAESTFGANRPH
jgi:CubicO group peptidase (beta-lactamase class C family)